MLAEVRMKVLFDSEVKDRRVTCSNTATFDQFRKHSEPEEKGTQMYLELMVRYQRNLPHHLLCEEYLYGVIQSIFC